MKKKCDDCLIGFLYLPYETEAFFERYLGSQESGTPDKVFNYCLYCRTQGCD